MRTLWCLAAVLLLLAGCTAVPANAETDGSEAQPAATVSVPAPEVPEETPRPTEDMPAETPMPPDPEDMPHAVGNMFLFDTSDIQVTYFYVDGRATAVLPVESGERLAALLNGREFISEWPACDPDYEDLFIIRVGEAEYMLHACCEAIIDQHGSATIDSEALEEILEVLGGCRPDKADCEECE